MDTDLVRSFAIAMIAIVNPLSKVPLYVRASIGQVGPARRRLAIYVTGVALAVLLLALLGGQPFLNLFGVDLAAFRVGGGIVILSVGLSMIRGSVVEFSTEDEDADATPTVQARARFRKVVVPMSMPIIAGPGSISTAIVYSARAEGLADFVSMAGVLVVVMTVVLVTLLASRRVQAAVGDTSLEIVTRFLGLILVGIAVQFVAEGLGEIFPAWTTPESVLQDDVD